MNKSPEEYFQEQHFAPAVPVRGTAFTEAEVAFMRKYMGMDAQEILDKLGIKAETQTEAPALMPEILPEPEPVSEKALARSEPESATPDAVDTSEVETFKETVGQQFMIIKAALDGLKQRGNDTCLSDALYRGLTTVQSSSSYMCLNEIKVCAERTAGIVDQGRKACVDFSTLTDLLEQESGIIEDMVVKAIAKMLGGAPTAMDATTPEAQAALPPGPEPVLEVAPNPIPMVETVSAPEPAPVYQNAPPVDLHHEMAEEKPLEIVLRKESEIQMVGFYIGKQEFTVPTLAVQEVIRYEVPAKMPSAPRFVAGLINLRGKMTPLVHLRDMLEIRQARETEDRFIIVCRRKGLQIGLIIERVHTMYRVPQADIEWGVEGLLGISNADFISGLLKLNESLVGIVSVDRIIDYMLE